MARGVYQLTRIQRYSLIMLLFERFNIAKPTVRSNSTLNRFGMYDGNIIGGALLGLGMGLTGACPGTVLPQLAHGVESARATAVGGLLGGLVYAKGPNLLRRSESPSSSREKPNQSVEPSRISRSGPLTIADKFNLSASTVWLAFEIAVLAIATISVATLPGKTEALIPTVAGGLLVAVAQATSILLTSTPLGVSAAYEQAGRLIWRNVLGDKTVQPPSTHPPKSLIFAIGILLGSVAAGSFMPALPSNVLVPVSTLQALVGGFVLSFGARIAGGCTSGHGPVWTLVFVLLEPLDNGCYVWEWHIGTNGLNAYVGEYKGCSQPDSRPGTGHQYGSRKVAILDHINILSILMNVNISLIVHRTSSPIE